MSNIVKLKKKKRRRIGNLNRKIKSIQVYKSLYSSYQVISIVLRQFYTIDTSVFPTEFELIRT